MNDFKCPNCGEDSTLIVKIYKMTKSENYIRCGRCLHVWLIKNRNFKDFVLNTITTIGIGLAFGGLIFCYFERLWLIYGIIVTMLMVVGVANYIVNNKK